MDEQLEQARDRISERIEPAKRNVIGLAEQQKLAGAHKIKEFARSVHGAADSFEKELPQVSRSIHDGATAIERASDRLEQRNIEELMGDIGRFARSKPLAFFGAAVLLGLAATRFVKSADTRHGS
jgi:hypothetical protein